MDDLDEHIREHLLTMPSDWHARATDTKERVRIMYEDKRKKAAMWSWIGSGIGICLMVTGIPALMFGGITGQASVAVAGAMMFLFGDGWITGSKLLYWIWHTRIQLERDIKEVHVDVLDLLKRSERIEAAVAGKTAPGMQ